MRFASSSCAVRLQRKAPCNGCGWPTREMIWRRWCKVWRMTPARPLVRIERIRIGCRDGRGFDPRFAEDIAMCRRRVSYLYLAGLCRTVRALLPMSMQYAASITSRVSALISPASKSLLSSASSSSSAMPLDPSPPPPSARAPVPGSPSSSSVAVSAFDTFGSSLPPPDALVSSTAATVAPPVFLGEVALDFVPPAPCFDLYVVVVVVVVDAGFFAGDLSSALGGLAPLADIDLPLTSAVLALPTGSFTMWAVPGLALLLPSLAVSAPDECCPSLSGGLALCGLFSNL